MVALPVILLVGKPRQGEGEFKANMSYITSLRLELMGSFVSKRKKSMMV